MTRAKDISKIITDADLSGTLDVTGDLTVDTNTLKVDSSNNRVGIGTSPATILHIKESSPIFTQETTGNVTTSGVAYQQVKDVSGSSVFTQGFAGLANCYQFGTSISNGFMRFLTGSAVERMRIDASGNVGIGSSSPDGLLTLLTANSNTPRFRLQHPTNNADATIDTYYDGSGTYLTIGTNVYQASNAALTKFDSAKGAGLTYYDSSGIIVFYNGAAGSSITERMRIDTSGNVGIGNTGNSSRKLDITQDSGQSAGVRVRSGGSGAYYQMFTGTANPKIGSSHNTDQIELHTGGSERVRIDSNGNLLVATTVNNTNVVGHGFNADGFAFHTRSGGQVLAINRQSDDGTLISFRQANGEEGTISVSGTTISYNGGHLSRWSQLADSTRDNTIVKGTVMTNLDQMAEWTTDGVTEDNEQLNCMAVSSVEGDANVAGVFVNWDNDDDVYTNDMNIAMTGDMVIRIAQGTTVARGDLLMSAGDGTAKPQGDDIVRSKTIAKVTSTNVSHTYDDGTYLVPCVLMAC